MQAAISQFSGNRNCLISSERPSHSKQQRDNRATELILDDDFLFLAKNGTSLDVSSIKLIVAKYVKKAGIRKRVRVHTLRHTFASHKADKNMSIATLQALMGHKKKETTLKYLHLARTNLRKEMVETEL